MQGIVRGGVCPTFVARPRRPPQASESAGNCILEIMALCILCFVHEECPHFVIDQALGPALCAVRVGDGALGAAVATIGAIMSSYVNLPIAEGSTNESAACSWRAHGAQADCAAIGGMCGPASGSQRFCCFACHSQFRLTETPSVVAPQGCERQRWFCRPQWRFPSEGHG